MTKLHKTSPIIAFVFNRPHHTERMLTSLSSCHLAKDSVLYIYSDAAKKPQDIDLVNNVRKLIKAASGFEKIEIIEACDNKGLAASVITGVSDIIKEHGRAIIVEDDLLFSPLFLVYMNACLNRYSNFLDVFSVSGYLPPCTPSTKKGDLSFVPRICSWGWATWRDRWEKVDWSIPDYNRFINDRGSKTEFSRAGRDMLDMLVNQAEGEAESWAIRFDYGRFRTHNSLTAYPPQTFVANIGFDGTGTHGERSERYHSSTLCESLPDFPDGIAEDTDLTERFSRFYRRRLSSRLAIYARRFGVHRQARKLYRKARSLLLR